MDECYKYYNPNPAGARVGDCTVRALCKATGKSWDEVYCGLCAYGYHRKDMPSANAVWGAYLRDQGFTRSFVGDGSGRLQWRPLYVNHEISTGYRCTVNCDHQQTQKRRNSYVGLSCFISE